jgi:hypothetical protein
MLRLQQLKGWVQELNVWADSMWDLNGEMIIQKMTDFSEGGPFNMAASPDIAAGVDAAMQEESE